MESQISVTRNMTYLNHAQNLIFLSLRLKHVAAHAPEDNLTPAQEKHKSTCLNYNWDTL